MGRATWQTSFDENTGAKTDIFVTATSQNIRTAVERLDYSLSSIFD
jgi:uncharacterized protein YcgI (DUF1989 family)